MPGSHQLAVAELLPRMVRDGLGALHLFNSSSCQMPRLEAAIPMHLLVGPPPEKQFIARANRLLGRAGELRVAALNQVAVGKLDHAQVRLMCQSLRRACGYIRAPARDCKA